MEACRRSATEWCGSGLGGTDADCGGESITKMVQHETSSVPQATRLYNSRALGRDLRSLRRLMGRAEKREKEEKEEKKEDGTNDWSQKRGGGDWGCGMRWQ